MLDTDWLDELHSEFVTYLRETEGVLWLALAGLKELGPNKDAVDLVAAASAKGLWPDDHEKHLAAHKKDIRTILRREVKEGFPRLLAQMVVSLWGSLELFVRDLASRWLAHVPKAREVDAVSGIKCAVADFWRLDDARRAEFVVDRLAYESRRLSGASRFQALLKPFGIAPKVAQATAGALFEMGEVRHVLVHRRGVADSKLVTNCSSLGLTKGMKVSVNASMLDGYRQATLTYFKAAVQRAVDRVGEMGHAADAT